MILPGSGNGSSLEGTTSRVAFSRKNTSAELVIFVGSAGFHSRYDFVAYQMHLRGAGGEFVRPVPLFDVLKGKCTPLTDVKQIA